MPKKAVMILAGKFLGPKEFPWGCVVDKTLLLFSKGHL
jgi:hypothetical protein